MSAKSYETKLLRDGNMCAIPVPFDPKTVFGKTRAPVKVTINGYTYRSTIAAMGGPLCIPLRKSHREAAGIEGSETVDVRLELDVETRDVDPPPTSSRRSKPRKSGIAGRSSATRTGVNTSRPSRRRRSLKRATAASRTR